MRRTALMIVTLAVLGLTASGCAKCGGFERIYLPYESGACNDRAPAK
jgi:hypothetical protein